MYAFWEYVLLEKPANIHSIYDTHQKLNIAAPDFEEWLMLFKTTLDENFTGKKKDLAWQRAMIIAHTFNSKMNPGTELNLHL
jgi:hemoglobin